MAFLRLHVTCCIKRRIQKLGHHILRYVSKFRALNVIINLLLAKNHRENILKRPVALLWYYNAVTSE